MTYHRRQITPSWYYFSDESEHNMCSYHSRYLEQALQTARPTPTEQTTDGSSLSRLKHGRHGSGAGRLAGIGETCRARARRACEPPLAAFAAAAFLAAEWVVLRAICGVIPEKIVISEKKVRDSKSSLVYACICLYSKSHMMGKMQQQTSNLLILIRLMHDFTQWFYKQLNSIIVIAYVSLELCL